ncbi:NrfD/PsrC family molybdoenzyme membrane anchor subunit [Caldinitratiruptor microaerophilus]|uniref:Oxidoreductase n=1 Tax=Caldinitratiruptor microaerophilus TaxID=671077 RepID=A0AA35G621_9FIRM|nr:NrfD/PsrC family molybdoenzyme membrane anchor subunit [Caldinitratiruptor microaerophilus]BDG60556.1 oxidoreductase [Caldinitratiruptor microaerophilus]
MARRAWMLFLGALTAAGMAAWAYQLARGLTVTGLTNTVSWGLYIIVFMFLVGLSAGGLIVAAGAQLMGGRQYRPLAPVAVLVSAVCIALAALMILPDLGRPDRVLRVLVSARWSSPLVWDVYIILTYLTISLVDLWLLTRPHEDERAVSILSAFALPVAVLVHSVTAWIFGLLQARPFWNSPLMAPFFVSSALVSGLSLVLLVAFAARRWLGLRVEDPVRDGLGKLLALFVAVDLYFLGSEVLTTAYSGSADHQAQLDLLLRGPLAPSFWVEVALGVFAFVVFAARRTRLSIPWAAAGAGAAIAGVFLKRVNIVMASMMLPLVHLPPGLTSGRPATPPASIWRTVGQYTPTWVEVVIVLGLLALGSLVVTAALPWAVRAARGGAKAVAKPSGGPVLASASDGRAAPSR